MSDSAGGAQALSCPSAQPDMENARVLGILSGTPEDPRIAYLEPGFELEDVTVELPEEIATTELFRFSAKCEEHRCAHFANQRCSLAKRIVEQLPEVVSILPRCQIRKTCRWHAEEGAAACRRCPQVVTTIPRADDALNRIALPTV